MKNFIFQKEWHDFNFPGVNICQHVHISDTILFYMCSSNIRWKRGRWTEKKCRCIWNTSKNSLLFSIWNWTSQMHLRSWVSILASHYVFNWLLFTVLCFYQVLPSPSLCIFLDLWDLSQFISACPIQSSVYISIKSINRSIFWHFSDPPCKYKYQEFKSIFVVEFAFLHLIWYSKMMLILETSLQS